jgi:ribosomal protein L1
MDMGKQDNRLNLEVKLPNGKGKEHKVIIFADDKNIVSKAQAGRSKHNSRLGNSLHFYNKTSSDE